MTERFFPFLAEHGFEIEVREDLDAYDEELLAGSDLPPVLHRCVSTEQRVAAAVAAGAELAGCHGGIIDAFRMSPQWLQLTGGQFGTHPGSVRDHEIEIVPERSGHEIVKGPRGQWRAASVSPTCSRASIRPWPAAGSRCTTPVPSGRCFCSGVTSR